MMKSPDQGAAAVDTGSFRLGRQRNRTALRLMLAAMVVLLAVGPFVFSPIFLMEFLAFAIFASGFNLLVGYVGLVSFGHAAYFGIGSYMAAFLVKSWHCTPEVAILGAGLAGAALGAVFGAVAIRRQGLYFAMITLALAQMTYFICVQVPQTGGEDGISSIPRGRLFGVLPLDSDLTMYFVLAVLFLICFAFVFRVIDSPFGYILRAIRDNERRSISLGFETNRYKLATFVISTALAGIAGGAKALALGIASLTDVHFSTSGQVVLMTLLGGLGTVFGPTVGAFIIVAMQVYLSDFGSWVTVFQGLILIVCILLFRSGIVGDIGRRIGVRL
jgi:branched-chain amino acid transport system permease protein